MPPKPSVVRQTPVPVKAVKPKAKTGNADSDDPWERLGSESHDDGFLKMLIFGGSGTGKTRTASTFPGPILWMICSGIRKSGELKSLSAKTREKITPIHIRNTGEILTLVKRQRETGRFTTVVLDHATGLQDYSMREILNIEEMPAQLSFGIAAREQWDASNGQCKEILRAMLNLDCHGVVLAQERDFNEKVSSRAGDTQTPAIGAGLTPGLATWLAPTCDYVCQTYKRSEMEETTQTVGEGDDAIITTVEVPTGKTQYCARVGPSDTVMTKFRVPEETDLPNFIVDPSYSKFMKLINGVK